MMMKKITLSNTKILNNFNKVEKSRYHIKRTNLHLTNLIVKVWNRLFISGVLKKYVQWFAFNKMQNRTFTYKIGCYITNRMRSVNGLTKLSRLKSREYIHQGYFIGIKKASW